MVQKGKVGMKNLVEPIKSKKDIDRIEKYLEKHSRRNRLIFAFGVNTGLRVSDILGLNVEDVEGKNYVEIREKKTGKYKRFPLNSKLKALIKDYLKERENLYAIGDETPLFVGKKHHRLHRSQVYRFLNEACEQLGIAANIGTHSMRKSFGYHFYKSGGELLTLMKMYKHENPTITLLYIMWDDDDVHSSRTDTYLGGRRK